MKTGEIDRSEPTFENQLWQARKLLKETGSEALRNPHALTGKICGCGSCFCCAALQVYNEWNQELSLNASDPNPLAGTTATLASILPGLLLGVSGLFP